VLGLVLGACDSEDLGDAAPTTPTIAEYVTEIPAFTALSAAVQEAGLAETLDTGGPFTVFAPVDAAFVPAIDASLNRQVAEKVLLHHVVAAVDSADALRARAAAGQALTPLAGADLTVTVIDEDGEGADTIRVNAATITNADAAAANGLVHVVDRLLGDAVDRATLTPRFTLFARLVREAGLEGALRTAGPSDGRTIFAPTNAAFLDALDANDNGEIESGEIPGNAADILQYHVVNGAVQAGDVPTTETTLTTLEGSTLTVVRTGDAVTVNPANEAATVTTPDVIVDNGVIHGIDVVLTP
jgi:uncharacterized surface protein with fasciclin (FAS1) repeats